MNKSRYFTIPTQINNHGRKKNLMLQLCLQHQVGSNNFNDADSAILLIFLI